jgi:hypothetical protein
MNLADHVSPEALQVDMETFALQKWEPYIKGVKHACQQLASKQ